MAEKGFEHAFSVEMGSRNYLKRVNLSDNGDDRVLIEGFLGGLSQLELIEDAILVIAGVNGIIRIDVTNRDVSNLLRLNRNKEDEEE